MSHAAGHGKGSFRGVVIQDDTQGPQSLVSGGDVDATTGSQGAGSQTSTEVKQGVAVQSDTEGPRVSSSGGDGDATTVPQGAGVQAGAEVKQGVTVQSDTEGPRVVSSGGDGDATMTKQGVGEQASAEEESGADEQVSSEEEQGADEQVSSEEEQAVDDQVDSEGPLDQSGCRGATTGSEEELSEEELSEEASSTRHAPKEALVEEVEEVEDAPAKKRAPPHSDESARSMALEEEVEKLRHQLRLLSKECATLRKGAGASPRSPRRSTEEEALHQRGVAWMGREEGRFLRFLERHYEQGSDDGMGRRKVWFPGDKWLPETLDKLPVYDTLRSHVHDLIDGYLQRRYHGGALDLGFTQRDYCIRLTSHSNDKFNHRNGNEASFVLLMACCMKLMNIDIRTTKIKQVININSTRGLKEGSDIGPKGTFIARRFIPKVIHGIRTEKVKNGFNFASSGDIDWKGLAVPDYYIGLGILMSYSHTLPPRHALRYCCERLDDFLTFLSITAKTYRAYYEATYKSPDSKQ